MRTAKMQIVFLIAVYIIQPIVSEVYTETEQLDILRLCPECTDRGPKNVSLNPRCVQCFCDLDCVKYGDCCIDILIENNLHTKQINHGMTCVIPTEDKVQLDNIGNAKISKKIEPPNENRTDAKSIVFVNDSINVGDFIEEELIFGYYIRAHYDTDFKKEEMCDTDFAPVTCNHGVTYINSRCAVLNKAEGCAPWLHLGKKIQSNFYAELNFLPPTSLELRVCDSVRSNRVISTCSPEYSSLSSLCSKYFSLVVDNEGNVYRNLFCFECNGGSMRIIEERGYNPFIYLTRFTPDFKKVSRPCDGKTSWFDSIARKCRPIKCHGEKILEDGLCLYNNRTGLGAKYNVQLQLRLNINHTIYFINQIIGHLMFRMQAQLSSTSYQIETSDQIFDADECLVLLNVWFEVTEDILLENVENKLMSIKWPIVNFGFKVKLQPYLLDLNEQLISRYYKSYEFLKLCCSVENDSNIPFKSTFERVTREMTCAYIEFDHSEYKLLQYTALIDHLNITLQVDLFSVNQNKLSVCLEYFLSQTNFVGTNDTIYISEDLKSNFDKILWYVTIACISLSMLSLFIIIITYTVFKELKTQPGINNLILSWNLFLAQMFLMVGVDKIKQVTLCKTLGIVTHFFWLSSIFWMNICSYHMFKVFVLGRLLICASHATVKQSMIYCIYGYGCAVLIISSTIIANVLQSDGKQLGYGGDICFLSNTSLVLYSFVIPLCFVIISNVIYFIWTVITIHRVKQEGKQTGERNNVYIYLKLSVVTGVFWIVSLLTNFLDTVVLDYISVILNGSQGVFLLWSLIINRKILRKYRTVFCKCIPDELSETSNSKKDSF